MQIPLPPVYNVAIQALAAKNKIDLATLFWGEGGGVNIVAFIGRSQYLIL